MKDHASLSTPNRGVELEIEHGSPSTARLPSRQASQESMSPLPRSLSTSILICPNCLTQYEEGRGVCPKDGARLKHLTMEHEESLEGKLIDGRWVIERKLGEGGMGAVYLANQLNIERKVAIKTMHRGLDRGHEFLERFLREANVASQVSHPNLVSIFDFGQTEDGQLFIVMEYLDGHTLSSRVQHGSLSLKQVLQIASQLCAALAAAHGAGIVHRDLKPDNIYLLQMPGDDIFVKLLDFGIAKHMNSKAMTQTGQVFGTPEYMSPEQCRGRAGIDPRSDLYSLGCILYELLTGRTPFKSETLIQVLFRHVSEPVPPIRRMVDDATLDAVEQLVFRLLEKSPRKRYDSALEAREAIEAVASALDRPELKMPAWQTVTPPLEEEGGDTARLEALSVERFEVLMQTRSAEEDEAPADEEGLDERLLPLDFDVEETQLDLKRVPEWVEPSQEMREVTPSSPPAARRAPRVASLGVFAILGASGVFAYDRYAGPDPAENPTPPTTPHAIVAPLVLATPDMGLDELVGEREEAQEEEERVSTLLLDSALSTANLLLYTSVTRAMEEARDASERDVTPPERQVASAEQGPRSPDVALLKGVRTRTSRTRRIDKASRVARGCLDKRLHTVPEEYIEHVGQKIAFAVSFEIAPDGAITKVDVTQKEGAPVKDQGLIACIERPYSQMRFSAISPLYGTERQGATLEFVLRQESP